MPLRPLLCRGRIWAVINRMERAISINMKIVFRLVYAAALSIFAIFAIGFLFSFVGKGRGRGEKVGLRFFIVSDWGWNGYKAQQEVADQMARSAEKIEPAFIVSCGDNFQVQGVASVQDPLWVSSFENVYKSVYLQCGLVSGPWKP